MQRTEGAAKPTLSRDFLLSLAGFVVLWAVAARMAGAPTLLPGPIQVGWFAWEECISGRLPAAIAATLLRVLIAFILAMAGGGLLGYLAGSSRRVNAWIDPWVVIALNLPVLVVVVLSYIWIGLNDTAAIVAVVVAKAPTVIVTVREGARALDHGLAEMAEAFHIPMTRRWRSLVLPQLLPYLAAAGRSGLSITWKIVLLVELMGRSNGVGYSLNLFFQNFDVTAILAYGLAFAGLMLLVETAALQPLERRSTAWRANA